MKIFTAQPDPKYRLMYPEDSVYDSEDWGFKCSPLAGILPLHFEAYFSNKDDKPTPDIAWIGMSTFAFRADVATRMLDLLEASGELLPFKIEGDQWYCLNILQKSDNVIDPQNSKYEIEAGEMRLGLKKPVFVVENLPKPPLFKIKDDNYTATYCIDKRDTEEDVLNNFCCAIAVHGYTGVKFEEVFDDSQ